MEWWHRPLRKEKQETQTQNTEEERIHAWAANREILPFYIHLGGMLVKRIWDQTLQVLALQECVSIPTWEQFLQQILNHKYSEVFEIACIYVDIYFSRMDLVVSTNLCFIFFLKAWVKAPISLWILLHFQMREVGQTVDVILLYK